MRNFPLAKYGFLRIMGVMEETLRAHLLTLSTHYEEVCGVTPQTIGKRALNDNRALLRIRDGGGFTVGTFDRLVRWFSENWPSGATWPDCVERPKAEASAAS